MKHIFSFESSEYVGLITVESKLTDDEVMEIGLELDALDIEEKDVDIFHIKTNPKDLNSIKKQLSENKDLKILDSQLTHCAQSPIEITEADENYVELFEQKIHQIVGASSIHMEVSDIYWNFE